MTAARKRNVTPSTRPALRLVGGEATIANVGAKRAKRRSGDEAGADLRTLVARLEPWEVVAFGADLHPLASATRRARADHEARPSGDRRAVAIALEALLVASHNDGPTQRREFLDAVATAATKFLDQVDARDGPTAVRSRRRPRVVDERASTKNHVPGRDRAVRVLVEAAELAVRSPLAPASAAVLAHAKRRGLDERTWRAGAAARTVLPRPPS